MADFTPPARNDGESDADYGMRVEKAREDFLKANPNTNQETTTQRAEGTIRTDDPSKASDIQNRQEETLKTRAAETGSNIEAGQEKTQAQGVQEGGAAPGGSNASSTAVPQGGAVGLEHQATNDTLGVTGAIRAADRGTATVGSEKTIRSLVPERMEGESDEDFEARAENFRKSSADTMVAQSPGQGDKPKFKNDDERRAAATPEQKRAWADQHSPSDARLRKTEDYA